MCSFITKGFQFSRSFGPTIPILIEQLIVFEPEHRLTASQVLKHHDLSDLVMTHTRYNLDFLKVNSSWSDKKIKVNADGTTKDKADRGKLKDEKRREKRCTSDSKLQAAKGRSNDQDGTPIERQISLTGISSEEHKHKHLDNKCADYVNVGSLGINNKPILETVNGIQNPTRLPNGIEV